jgi:hypothetical protein
MSKLNIVIENIDNKIVRNNMFVKDNFNSNNHWLKDENKLYGEANTIYFRYSVENKL